MRSVHTRLRLLLCQQQQQPCSARVQHGRVASCVASVLRCTRRHVSTSDEDNNKKSSNKGNSSSGSTSVHVPPTSRIVLRPCAPAAAASSSSSTDVHAAHDSASTAHCSSSSSSSSAVTTATTTATVTTTTTTTTATAAKPEDGPMTVDSGPLRATGLWSVHDVVDVQQRTVDFRRIDEVESDVIARGGTRRRSSAAAAKQGDGDTLDAGNDDGDDAVATAAAEEEETAVVSYDEEARWRRTLMFVHKFRKTPRHLTWRQLGEEIECLDCVIDVDAHRPEEVYTMRFFFTDKASATRDCVWQARNDVSVSEGLTDLLAAIGSCLGRADVHRTIRFDDGQGCMRDVAVRKRARYTSDITLAFRPPQHYNVYERKYDMDEYEAAAAAEGASMWSYHPALMEPEYSELDYHDPEGTYTVAMSAHGFSYIVLRALRRLLARPLRDFYRASQLLRTSKMPVSEDVGVVHAVKGWLGVEDRVYPHYTPLEAVQEHWLGADAPFSLCAMINKLREMTYLTRENPELRSWLSVRHHDTHVAVRNMSAKLLGVGASTLFLPVAHDATVNRLLPKQQQRRLSSHFSVSALLGMPDETRRLGEYKQLTGQDQIASGSHASDGGGGGDDTPQPQQHGGNEHNDTNKDD